MRLAKENCLVEVTLDLPVNQSFVNNVVALQLLYSGFILNLLSFWNKITYILIVFLRLSFLVFSPCKCWNTHRKVSTNVNWDTYKSLTDSLNNYRLFLKQNHTHNSWLTATLHFFPKRSTEYVNAND